jgi:putative membrane protein insertion efficiency factor
MQETRQISNLPVPPLFNASHKQKQPPMQPLLLALVRLPRLLLIGLVRVYQYTISPHLGPTCRFHPTCSQYAVQAVREYGVLKGLVLIFYRVGRCHPWGGHGYDPPRWFGEADAAPRSQTKPAGPSE